MQILGLSIFAIAASGLIASPIGPGTSEIGPRDTDITYPRVSFEYERIYYMGIRQAIITHVTSEGGGTRCSG